MKEGTSFLIGMSAIEVIRTIAKLNPGINSFHFFLYNPIEGVREKTPIVSDVILLSRLLHHNPAKATFSLDIKDLMDNDLINTFIKLAEGSPLAILSKVMIGKSTRHIPLMDFRCQDRAENLGAIKDFLRVIGQKKGAILFSGKSYHYYGAELLSQDKWFDFLAECLLFTGFVDERYIGHTLLDRCGALRIIAGGIRETTPQVVEVID